MWLDAIRFKLTLFLIFYSRNNHTFSEIALQKKTSANDVLGYVYLADSAALIQSERRSVVYLRGRQMSFNKVCHIHTLSNLEMQCWKRWVLYINSFRASFAKKSGVLFSLKITSEIYGELIYCYALRKYFHPYVTYSYN